MFLTSYCEQPSMGGASRHETSPVSTYCFGRLGQVRIQKNRVPAGTGGELACSKNRLDWGLRQDKTSKDAPCRTNRARNASAPYQGEIRLASVTKPC